jgi:hypothetical protein
MVPPGPVNVDDETVAVQLRRIPDRESSTWTVPIASENVVPATADWVPASAADGTVMAKAPLWAPASPSVVVVLELVVLELVVLELVVVDVVVVVASVVVVVVVGAVVLVVVVGSVGIVGTWAPAGSATPSAQPIDPISRRWRRRTPLYRSSGSI